MLKKLLLTTFSIAAFAGAASVNAATYNFVDLIDNGAPGNFSGTLGDGTDDSGTIPTGEAGYTIFTWTVDGLALTASATKSGAAFAYLDSSTAGLGVCGILNGSNQCSIASDDNVTTGEVLNISFAQTVSIDVSAMIFRNAGHGELDKDTLTSVFVDTGSSSSSISNLVSGNSVITGKNFAFSTTNDSQQFYISSLTAVPIPAAAWLFGSALIGLAGIARKGKMS